MRAWNGLARLQDERSFGSWVLTIADNVCREWIRRKQTREKHEAMGFHDGWGKAADQLAALARTV